MVGESNQNVILIQIDASSFAEFEISEFEIARVDCNLILRLYISEKCWMKTINMAYFEKINKMELEKYNEIKPQNIEPVTSD